MANNFLKKNQNPADKNKFFIARQPIFDKNRKVYGYELLFRSSMQNFFDPAVKGNRATSKVIIDSFLLTGINKVAEGKKAFINFGADMIIAQYPALLPKNKIVIEVLEDIDITPEIIASCKKLSQDGYIIALDDFLYNSRTEPLLRIADIVKFDVQQMTREQMREQVLQVKPYNTKLLAEKIQSNEEFDVTREMGFDYFQGYFFKRPHIIAGRDIPGSKLHYLQMLRLIKDENYDFVRLAKLIADDISLSYKLLKYVNTAFYHRGREIRSMQSAVSLIGELDLRKWLSLIMISYLAEDKPDELIKISAYRARFCEMLGDLISGRVESDQYHTVGMFSLLDCLLDRPMEQILAGLNLSDDINQALLGTLKGKLYGVLMLVTAYENGNWGGVFKLAKQLDIKIEILPELYEAALESVQNYDIF